jgi:hypothetical protein
MMVKAPGLIADDLTVALTYDPDNKPGSLVTVASGYTTRPIVALMAPSFDLTLSTRLTMVIEN